MPTRTRLFVLELQFMPTKVRLFVIARVYFVVMEYCCSIFFRNLGFQRYRGLEAWGRKEETPDRPGLRAKAAQNLGQRCVPFCEATPFSVGLKGRPRGLPPFILVQGGGSHKTTTHPNAGCGSF